MNTEVRIPEIILYDPFVVSLEDDIAYESKCINELFI